MVNVQVRGVTDEVLAGLKARAEQAGQSLQAFLSDLLSAEAAVAINAGILDDIERSGGAIATRPGEAAAWLRAEREERMQALLDAER